MHPTDRDLLRELLSAHGPGQEDDVREICRRELAPGAALSGVCAAGRPG